jgi:hypothetical protein
VKWKKENIGVGVISRGRGCPYKTHCSRLFSLLDGVERAYDITIAIKLSEFQFLVYVEAEGS